MKRKFVAVLMLMCLISLSIFTGCGLEGSPAATGIKFTNAVYDETEQANVIYVDVNVDTFLEYKVYPSSAKNYVVYWDRTKDSSENKYNFQNGHIRVKDASFTKMEVTVRLNEYSDSAFVKLREYPSKIFYKEESENIVQETIFAGTYKEIQLSGSFNDFGNRNLKNGEYQYAVTSSDPSVVEVVDSVNMLLKSTGRKGQSDITVKILDSAGQEKQGLSTTFRMNVKENIADAYVTVGGEVVSDGQTYQYYVSPSDLSQELQIDVRYFNEKLLLLSDEKFIVLSSDESVVKVNVTESGYTLKFVKEETSDFVKEGKSDIIIQSANMRSDGTPYKVKFTIRVNKANNGW